MVSDGGSGYYKNDIQRSKIWLMVMKKDLKKNILARGRTVMRSAKVTETAKKKVIEEAIEINIRR